MASRLLLALMLLMAAPVAAQTPGEADPEQSAYRSELREAALL